MNDGTPKLRACCVGSKGRPSHSLSKRSGEEDSPSISTGTCAGAAPEAPAQRPRAGPGGSLRAPLCRTLALGPHEPFKLPHLGEQRLEHSLLSGVLQTSTGQGDWAACVHTRAFEGPVRHLDVDFRSRLGHCLVHFLYFLGKPRRNTEKDHISGQFSVAPSAWRSKGSVPETQGKPCPRS